MKDFIINNPWVIIISVIILIFGIALILCLGKQIKFSETRYHIGDRVLFESNGREFVDTIYLIIYDHTGVYYMTENKNTVADIFEYGLGMNSFWGKIIKKI